MGFDFLNCFRRDPNLHSETTWVPPPTTAVLAKQASWRPPSTRIEASTAHLGGQKAGGGGGGDGVPAPGHPATSWLLRTSSHCRSQCGSTPEQHCVNLPTISEAALVDRIERRPDRVAVITVRAAPPLGVAEEGAPLESWCSALHLSDTVASLLNTPLPSDYNQFITTLLRHDGRELQAALRLCGLYAWEVASSGSPQVASPGNHQVASSGSPQVASPGKHQVASSGSPQVASPGKHQVASPGKHQVASPGNHQVAAAGGQQQAAQPLAPLATVMVAITGLDFGLTLAITPFLIKASKATYQPAVFIEHLVEHHGATLEQQMRFTRMLLSRAPAILTICDLQGNVLHQNTASIQYAGNHVPIVTPTALHGQTCPSSKPPYNYLQQALQHEPEHLDELLEELAMGSEWSAGCVKVPASLQGVLATTSSPMMPETPILTHTIFSTASSFQGETAAGSSALVDMSHSASPQQTGAQSSAAMVANGSFRSAGWGVTVDSSSACTSVEAENNQRRAKSLECPNAGWLEPVSQHKSRRASGLMPLSTGQPTRLPPAVSSPPTSTGENVLTTSNQRKVVRPATSRLHLLMKQSPPQSRGSSFRRGPASSGSNICNSNASNVVVREGGASHRGRDIDGDSFRWSCDINWTPTGEIKILPHVKFISDVPEEVQATTPQSSGSEMGQAQEPPTSWHEIKAWPTVDPTTGATLVVISQVDMTERMQAEMRITQVSEACVSLLELMFPRHVIEHLTVKPLAQFESPPDAATDTMGTMGTDAATLDRLATKHECVTLFFCDIVGFTSMSKEVEPVQVMQFLNSLYSAYDQLVDEFGVYKVETVGDCYVVAGGLMTQDEEGFACVDKEGRNDGAAHALAVYRFAQAVLRVAASTPMPHNGQPVQIRIGLHSGPITSGIIGHRMPKFCLFGDSMNTCSRMETTAPYGSIHLSQATYELLAEQQAAQGLVCTGGVEVKGKGRMVTYVYTPPAAKCSEDPAAAPDVLTHQPTTQPTQGGTFAATPPSFFPTSGILVGDRAPNTYQRGNSQTLPQVEPHSPTLIRSSGGTPSQRSMRSRGTSRMGQEAFGTLDPSARSGGSCVAMGSKSVDQVGASSGSFSVALDEKAAIQKAARLSFVDTAGDNQPTAARSQHPRHGAANEERHPNIDYQVVPRRNSLIVPSRNHSFTNGGLAVSPRQVSFSGGNRGSPAPSALLHAVSNLHHQPDSPSGSLLQVMSVLQRQTQTRTSLNRRRTSASHCHSPPGFSRASAARGSMPGSKPSQDDSERCTRDASRGDACGMSARGSGVSARGSAVSLATLLGVLRPPSPSANWHHLPEPSGHSQRLSPVMSSSVNALQPTVQDTHFMTCDI